LPDVAVELGQLVGEEHARHATPGRMSGAGARLRRPG
jgi:hypothetical protein